MSSFNAKKRNTNATRKRTRQRLAGTEEDGGRRGPEHQLDAGKAMSVEERLEAAGLKRTGAGFKKPEPWAARLAARANNVEGPQDADLQGTRLQILVPGSANDKKDAVVEFLNKLRELEAKARQKTRVVVFCELPRTARSLEAALGHMVAKKTPSRGYRGLGLGAATRTSYENSGATTLQPGMQETYVQSILREFSGCKTPTIVATDAGAVPLLMHTGKIGHVISYDSPESLAQHRERVSYAGKSGATFTMVWSRTRKEKETMGPVIQWMEEQGCAIPPEVRSDLGLAGPVAFPAGATAPSVSAPPEPVEQKAQDDNRRGLYTMRLATLSQLDEATLDGASAGASASCGAIPAQSIVELHSATDVVPGSGATKGKTRSTSTKNKNKNKNKNKDKDKDRSNGKGKKRKRGAALLIVTEHESLL
jgi:hypothetical protein